MTQRETSRVACFSINKSKQVSHSRGLLRRATLANSKREREPPVRTRESAQESSRSGRLFLPRRCCCSLGACPGHVPSTRLSTLSFKIFSSRMPLRSTRWRRKVRFFVHCCGERRPTIRYLISQQRAEIQSIDPICEDPARHTKGGDFEGTTETDWQ